MEALFKKYFWVINLAVLSAVAWLVAQTIVDYLSARYLTIQDGGAEMAEVSADPTLLKKANPDGLSQELTSRRPFNTDPIKVDKPVDPECEPKCEGKTCGDNGCGGSCGECADGETCEAGNCAEKEEEPQQSELNIELKGTMANPTDPSLRFANIIADGSPELVAVGTEVLGKATVVDIQPKILYLREGNKLTHVGLWGEAPKAGGKGGPNPRIRNTRTANLKRPDPSKTRPRPRTRPGRPGSFDYSKGVKKEGDFAYKIDKQMLDEQLTDLTQLGMQARVIPNYRKGKYEGFKLVGVRPGSLYRAIGIRSGDIVRSINGRAINSPNKAMELFNQLKSSSAIALEVERRGKIENFNYTIQ